MYRKYVQNDFTKTIRKGMKDMNRKQMKILSSIYTIEEYKENMNNASSEEGLGETYKECRNILHEYISKLSIEEIKYLHLTSELGKRVEKNDSGIKRIKEDIEEELEQLTIKSIQEKVENMVDNPELSMQIMKGMDILFDLNELKKLEREQWF